MDHCFASIGARSARIGSARPVGRVVEVHGPHLRLAGLSASAAIGDQVQVSRPNGSSLRGEIVRLNAAGVEALADGSTEGINLGASVALQGPPVLAPDDTWIGRVIDPDGNPLDGRPLLRGARAADLRRRAPDPASRRGFGPRLETGLAAFNTFLPIARGQRLGLFAGSGVGKSNLLGTLARRLDADVVVVALVGERGREVGEFVRKVLGPVGLARAVVVAAPSDRPALSRRRCAWSAMAVAEHFRDEGKHVLLLADSITRFAEAHRDASLGAGETADLSGFPASTTHQIMALCERAGPGAATSGDITAVFTVLVAGSDMEGMIADTLRGVLDGHVVLSREIAERGRYPAIDILKSVSRSLPDVASQEENEILRAARQALGRHADAELMVQSGLYVRGNDPLTDHAIDIHPRLDAFLGNTSPMTVPESFDALTECTRSEPD